MLHRVVVVVQAVAAVAVVVTVVLLFTVQPTVAGSEAPDLEAGAGLFAANCSGCHGPAGEGGVGPPLAGGLSRFDSIDQVVTFVSTGVPGRMPGFETRLSPDEVNAIVEFVWSDLAGR